MSIDKSELKILITNNLGVEIEDQYEAMLRLAHGLEASSDALVQASKVAVLQMCNGVTAELQEGKIKDLPALGVAELIKRYVIRMGGLLEHIALTQKQKAAARHSEANGLKIALSVIKKSCDKEREKIKALQDHVAAGSPPVRGAARPSGVRPGPSVIDQRKAATADRKKKEEEQAKAQAEPKKPKPRRASHKPKVVDSKAKPPQKKAKSSTVSKQSDTLPKSGVGTVLAISSKEETLRRREEARRQQVG